MLTLSDGNKNVNMSFRYKDFFIDFLACLIPGFVFLVLSLAIIAITFFVSFRFVDFGGSLKLFPSLADLTKLAGLFYFPFWFHVSLLILAYMFGFFLYRQDPKVPDHVSYLRNRKTVKGWNEWVVKNSEGLSPKEVQFPYCNLARYLRSRGFTYDEGVINWNCERERTEGKGSSSQKNRSKAFINKLKMRIAFFHPEALSAIIKNEAHIRFASSMWYGFSVLIKMLYGSILFLFIYQNALIFKGDFHHGNFLLLNVVNVTLGIISIKAILEKKNDHKIYDSDHKGDEKFIDTEAEKLNRIYRKYDMLPFLFLLSITAVVYALMCFGTLQPLASASIVLFGSCTLSIVAFLIFYAKQKIETSFHYQRVREIVYVMEVANLAHVVKDSDIEKLYQLMLERLRNREESKE